MILLFDKNRSREKYESEIIEFAVSRMAADKPSWVKILDPYFLLEKLFIATKNQQFWLHFFEEASTITSLSSATVITGKPFKEFIARNQQLRNIKELARNAAEYTFTGYSNLTVTAHYYMSSGGHQPDLHDRWLIWGHSHIAKGLHFGSFQDDVYGKDFTITELNGIFPAHASARFDALVTFCQHQTK